LIYPPEVRSIDWDRSVGRLANVTAHGIQVNGTDVFQPGKIYALSFSYPEEWDLIHSLEFTARCCWFSQTESENQSGFQIERISDEDRAYINCLIEEYSALNALPVDE
jgi:hypothetical protein